jgi:regulator of replication initiation timing
MTGSLIAEANRLVVENRELRRERDEARTEVAYRVATGDSRADHIVELLAENRSLHLELDAIRAVRPMSWKRVAQIREDTQADEDRRYDMGFDAARDQYAEDRER